MSLSVDMRLDPMALNSKRPREYIPTEMLEYLIKLKFDRQVKAGNEMYILSRQESRINVHYIFLHLQFTNFLLVLDQKRKSIFLSTCAHDSLYLKSLYLGNGISTHFYN